MCVCVYIYIYINIYILTYYLLALTVTRKKKKKLPEFRDNNISEYCLGEKGKKRKGQLRHTNRKKSRDMQSVGQNNNIGARYPEEPV